MYRLNPSAPDIPAWLIVDQNYRDRYLFQEVAPLLPLPQSWYDAGAVFRSPTIAGLAAQIGITAANLQATVTRFNGFAASRPTPAWRPCGCRPTTRSRSSRAISAPRAGWSPMPAPG